MTSSALTIASALEPPPASRKLAGRAARLGDDVERRHAEPGAVGEDADVAVELDVGEALFLRHLLLRVLDRVGDLGQVLVAEERVAVDRHLGVEGDDLAVGGDDQRVDLDQRRVLLARHLGQLRQHLGGLVERVLGEPGGVDDRPRRGGVELAGRVDVDFDQGVGVLGGDRLDVHAALGGDHRQQLLLAAVEDDRGVVLVGDVGAALDPDLVDAEGTLAVRADDVHADDVVGVLRAPRRRPWRS